MSIRKLAMVAALGLSMASAPVLAQTTPAARTGAEMVDASSQDDDWGGGTSTTTYVIAFFVVIVIAIGIYFAIDKDDGRTSP